jgi:hypothetical protein
MRRWLLFVLVAAIGCAHDAKAPALANRGEPEVVELAWHARMDDRDWEHVTLVVDGTAGGPDTDGDTAPDGCTSEPDKANREIQMFHCGGAARWYSATLTAGEVVVTRFDEWLDPHRLTSTVVRRVRVRGRKLRVLAYRAT